MKKEKKIHRGVFYNSLTLKERRFDWYGHITAPSLYCFTVVLSISRHQVIIGIANGPIIAELRHRITVSSLKWYYRETMQTLYFKLIRQDELCQLPVKSMKLVL